MRVRSFEGSPPPLDAVSSVPAAESVPADRPDELRALRLALRVCIGESEGSPAPATAAPPRCRLGRPSLLCPESCDDFRRIIVGPWAPSAQSSAPRADFVRPR